MSKPYSFKNDIWSFGVLLYEMMSLKMPFDAKRYSSLCRKRSGKTIAYLFPLIGNILVKGNPKNLFLNNQNNNNNN